MRKFNAIIFICLTTSLTTYSQDDSSSRSSRQADRSDAGLTNAGTIQIDSTGKLLEQVTVTGTRRLRRSLLVPYSISSVSKETMQEQLFRSTPESLTGTTGVFVQKTNHGGGSPFVRGLTGNQTLILVDGIRLNNSTFRYGPNQYLNTIDPYTINRIEVARGTGSVQYGSDAMGGVLQVLTTEPGFKTGASAWSGRVAGRYMTGDMEKTVRGEGSYSAKNFAAMIGATYKKFGDLVGGDTTGKQSPSGYDEFSYDAKLKFALASNVGLTIAHQFLQQDEVPIYHRVRLENFAVNEFDPQRRLLTYAKLAIDGNSPLFNTVSITASWQQHVEGRNSQKNGSNVFRLEKDEVNTLGLTTDIHSQITNTWSANTGVELYSDKVNSRIEDRNLQSGINTEKRGLYPDDSRYGNYSVYSLHHFDLNKWVIEAGVRYNFFRITIEDTTLGKVTINPSSFVYNASVLYKLSKAQSAYLSFNTGFRAPNVDDMGTLGIVDFRYEVPATDLKPERSRTLEIGYKLQASKFSAAIAGYYMHLENLITRIKSGTEVINGYPVYRKENVDEAYIKGIEAELAYQLTKRWNLSGNIAFTKGQSLTKNEPLRRIPPVHGRIITSYRIKKWSASAELLLAGDQDRLAQGDKDDNRIPRGGTPAWEVFNVYAGYEAGIFRVNLAFQNLFNEDYRTHGSGINGVGRSLAVSAAVRF